jgi:hypothetical protein
MPTSALRQLVDDLESGDSSLNQTVQRIMRLRDEPGQLTLPGVPRPEPSEEQLREMVGALQRAESRQADAAQALLDAENIDDQWDDFREQAVQNLEEAGYSAEELDTKYHRYQRVDKDAPYREITVTDPALDYTDPHYDTEGLVVEARGEIHGDTYLMIEAQSDFAQRAHREVRGGASLGRERALTNYPFYETERWAQLGTGASLRQAAEEGLDAFAWVTPQDRQKRANLAIKAGTITYGSAVPNAVKRIFQWLDEPMLEGRLINGRFVLKADSPAGFPAVKLTPEMRKKILKAGIPALGTIPFLPGLLTESDKTR